MSGVVVVSDKQYAKELAKARFRLEPGLVRIFRLESPNEGLPDEPLKLLAVNRNTLPLGIRPVQFPARIEGAAWYPAVAIIEVTPKEFQEIKKNPALLPNGWHMAEEYRRRAS
jgi:hypothetical protein